MIKISVPTELSDVPGYIRAVRNARRMNQSEFAKLTGSTTRSISNYETGAKVPHLSVWLAITNL